MDSRERRFLLAVIGQALDANPANLHWFANVTPARDLTCLHFASYDSGVVAGVTIEARARTLQTIQKRRQRKHRKAKREAG